MALTIPVQIHRRDDPGAGPQLKAGELAYSYGSGKLFIGNTGATVNIEIGGDFFTSLLSATAGVATADKAVILDSNGEIDTWVAASYKVSAVVGAGFVKNDAAGNLIFGESGEQTDLFLTDLTDVNITSATLNQYLCFDGFDWVNAFIPFENLSDVTLTSPTSGEILSFNGSAWVNSPAASLPGVPTILDDLTDVDTTSTTPNTGDHLEFDGSLWVPAAPPAGGGATNLNALTDVTITGVAGGEFLRNDGAGQFLNVLIVEADISDLQNYSLVGHSHVEADIQDLQAYLLDITGESIDDLSDVDTTGISTGDHLIFNGTNWVPVTNDFIGLADTPVDYSGAGLLFLRVDSGVSFVEFVSISLSDLPAIALDDLSDVILITPASGQYLRFDGSDWRDADIVEADISDLQNYSLVSHTHVEADITDLQGYLLDITGENIGDLSDVSASAPSSGQFLVWTGTEWAPFTLVSALDLDDLGDVTISSPVTGHVIHFDGADWVNDDPTTIGLVTVGASQTLTNKTLTTPIIDQINPTTILTVAGDLAANDYFGANTTLTGDLGVVAVTASGLVSALDFKSTNPTASTPGFVKNDASGTLFYGQVISLSLNDLSGVFVPTPTNNQLLTFVTGNARWEAVSLSQVMALGDLTDVDLTAGPVAGEHLEFDGNDWVPAPATDPLGLNDLTDVTLVGAGTGDFLRHNGSEFVNTTLIFTDLPAIDLDDLNDVSVASPSTNEVLTFTGSQWEAAVASSGAIGSLTDVIISSPAIGQVLEFDGSDWKNTATPRLSSVDASDTKPVVEFFTGHISINHSHLTITTGPATDGPVLSSASAFASDVDLVFHTQGTGCFRFRPGGSNPVEGFVKNDAQGELLLGQPVGTKFDELDDVFVPSPNDQNALVFVDANNRWEAVPIPGLGTIDLDDLGDVDVASPNDANVLTFNNTSGNWEAAAPAGGGGVSDLDDLSDVTISSPASSEYLCFNGSIWVNSLIPLGDLDDVNVSGATNAGDVMTFDGASGFFFAALNLNSLANVDLNTNLPVDGDHLVFDIVSGNWLPVAPSGGGGPTALDDLTDVTITTPAIDALLQFDGSQWVDQVNLVIDSTAATYWGSIAVNDTWRAIRTGDDLAFERREGATYVEKAKFTASSFVTVGSITGASYVRSGITVAGIVKHDLLGNFNFETLVGTNDIETDIDLVNPKIRDSNLALVTTFGGVASAAHRLEITNAASGDAVRLAVFGCSITNVNQIATLDGDFQSANGITTQDNTVSGGTATDVNLWVSTQPIFPADQTIAALMPELQTAVTPTGQDALQFDGASKPMVLTNIPGAPVLGGTGWTIATVVKLPPAVATGQTQVIWGTRTGGIASQMELIVDSGATGIRIRRRDNAFQSSLTLDGDGYNLGDWVIVVMRFEDFGTSNSVTVRINKVEKSFQGTTINFSESGVNLGAADRTGTDAANCSIAAHIIYDRPLGLGEIIDLENFLELTYGISAGPPPPPPAIDADLELAAKNAGCIRIRNTDGDGVPSGDVPCLVFGDGTEITATPVPLDGPKMFVAGGGAGPLNLITDVLFGAVGFTITNPTAAMTWGVNNLDGTWRAIRTGNDLAFERFESGNYAEKAKFTASSFFTSGSITVDGDINTSATSGYHFGDPTVDTTWRMNRVGNQVIFSQRNGGTFDDRVIFTSNGDLQFGKQFGGQAIKDANGANFFRFDQASGTPVNFIAIGNATATVAPSIVAASGVTTNVDLSLRTRGTGQFVFESPSFITGRLAITFSANTSILKSFGTGTNSNLQFETKGTGDFIFKPSGGNPAAGLLGVDSSGNLLFNQGVSAETIALTELSDVDTTGRTTGDFLRFDGSEWVDATIVDDDVPDTLTLEFVLDSTGQRVCEFAEGGAGSANHPVGVGSGGNRLVIFNGSGPTDSVGIKALNTNSSGGVADLEFRTNTFGAAFGDFYFLPNDAAPTAGAGFMKNDASGKVLFGESLNITDADVPDTLTLDFILDSTSQRICEFAEGGAGGANHPVGVGSGGNRLVIFNGSGPTDSVGIKALNTNTSGGVADLEFRTNTFGAAFGDFYFLPNDAAPAAGAGFMKTDASGKVLFGQSVVIPDDITLQRIEVLNVTSTGLRFEDSSNRALFRVSYNNSFAPEGNIRIESGVTAGTGLFAPKIRTEGSETNIGLTLQTKGTGAFNFQPNGANPSAGVLSVDSSGNLLFAQALTDSDISNDLTLDEITVPNPTSTGTRFRDSSNREMFVVSYNNSFAPFGNLRIETGVGVGPAAQPRIVAEGETNLGMEFHTAGTGTFIFQPGGADPSAGLLSVDGSGNLLFDTTLVAADIPVDLEVNSLSVSATGSGINFFDTFDNQMFEMDRGGSPAVNWFNTRSSIAGVNPVFTVNGSDTNIGMRFATKGSGTFQLFPGNVAGAVGPLGLDASGNITFDSLTLTDADIPNELTIRILTGTSATPSGADIQINDAIGNEVFDMKRAGSAVNYVRLWNAGTGAAPFFEVLGEDTDIDFELHAKGTGAVRIVSSDFVVDADGLFDGSIILTDAATDPKAVYWGDPSTNGSWRIILISGTLHSQKLIAGTWTDEAIDGTP